MIKYFNCIQKITESLLKVSKYNNIVYVYSRISYWKKYLLHWKSVYIIWTNNFFIWAEIYSNAEISSQ